MKEMSARCVMVTGASGLLGRAVMERLGGEVRVLALANLQAEPGMMALDLTDTAAVGRLRDEPWDAVVHCAAHRSPDFCETHRRESFALNADVPASLARMAAERGAGMIHISTDYVFPGTNPPYGETDTACPVNVYGESKLEAERLVMGIHPAACVLRIGALYAVPSERVSSPMVAEGIEAVLGGRPNVQDHVLKRYPLFIDDVAEVVRFLLARDVAGIVHAGTGQGVTRYEWALMIGKLLGVRTEHIKPSTADATRKAPRPPDAKLSVGRLREIGGPIPRDCAEVLPDVLKRSEAWIVKRHPLSQNL